MKIALVDISIYGHRMAYFKNYSKIFVELGHEVIIFCPQTNDLKNHLDAKTLEHTHFVDYELQTARDYFFKEFNSSLNIFNNLAYLSKKIKSRVSTVDFVFFLGLDNFIPTFSPVSYFKIKFYKILNRLIPTITELIFPFKWSGINLRLDLEVEHIHKSRNCIAIGSLNEYFDYRNERLTKKSIVFPDITHTKIVEERTDLENLILARAKGRKIISILGSIDKRKSVITFLDIAQISSSEDWFFVIAGIPVFESFDIYESDRIKSIGDSLENCFLHLNNIEDGPDFNALIKMSDVVFASYLKFHNSSNILTKAAFFKRPVIVSDHSCMGERIKKYKTGETMQEGMVSDGKAVINRILNNFNSHEAAYGEYFAMHSEKKLKSTIENLLKRI